jgi:hypothetical protein
MNNRLVIPLLATLLWAAQPAAAVEKNGFELDDAAVAPEKIMKGGPPRDGIPALSSPEMIDADKADYLRDTDQVLGVNLNGDARAYPTRILVWHEIVNDTIGGTPVAVTFCPLCGTGVVFSRLLDGRILEFGVSGLLYNSDMLLYDRQTESLFSQIPGKAISGRFKGQKLDRIAIRHTQWRAWRKQHPDTRVLSRETGHQRDYDDYPYRGYEQSRQLMSAVEHRDRRYHPKDLVIGLSRGNEARVWPFHELKKTEGRFQDEFDGENVTVIYNRDTQSARVLDADGNALPATTGFWFAWMTFYPHSSVFQLDKED